MFAVVRGIDNADQLGVGMVEPFGRGNYLDVRIQRLQPACFILWRRFPWNPEPIGRVNRWLRC